MEAEILKPATLIKVDELINNPNLKNEPKSVLVLAIFKLSRVLLPEVADNYWTQLLKLGASLPVRYREEFNELKKSFKPAADVKPGKFHSEVYNAIEIARQKRDTEPVVSRDMLIECKTKISKRWWTFGKRSLWLALLPELFESDRREALESVVKLSRKSRIEQIRTWNRITPLTPEEWELLGNNLRSGQLDILEEILDENGFVLNISEKVTEDIGKSLIMKIHTVASAEATEDFKAEVEKVREKSYYRLQSLISCQNDKFPEKIRLLMESFCMQIMTNVFYETEKSWVDRMTEIRNLLNFWKGLSDQSHQYDQVTAFLKNKAPRHLKGFALAHWFAITSSTDEAAENSFKELSNEEGDLNFSQAWFLIILVRQDRGQLAYKISRLSDNSAELTPRILREWILTNRAEVVTSVPVNNLPDDIISQFFLLPSIEEQMEFLRIKTNYGNDPLPKEMWRLPDFLKVFSVMEASGFLPLDSDEHLFTNFYFKSEDKKKQIQGYIKQYGFGQYIYSEIDKTIIKVLNKWEIEYPDEVSVLFNKLWHGFIPSQAIIEVDVLRNSLFDRYRDFFAVHPESLQNFFIKWLKGKFVDNSVQWTIGQTTYTFSLKDVAPFIYCLQAARAIADIAPLKCDQILADAISKYNSSDSLMNSAAVLYVSDKNDIPVDPPAKLKSSELIKDWQLGIIEASLKKITNSLIDEINESAKNTLKPESAVI